MGEDPPAGQTTYRLQGNFRRGESRSPPLAGKSIRNHGSAHQDAQSLQRILEVGHLVVLDAGGDAHAVGEIHLIAALADEVSAVRLDGHLVEGGAVGGGHVAVNGGDGAGQGAVGGLGQAGERHRPQSHSPNSHWRRWPAPNRRTGPCPRCRGYPYG